jgi:hypothetical protein
MNIHVGHLTDENDIPAKRFVKVADSQKLQQKNKI